jgi:hypothetical protein
MVHHQESNAKQFKFFASYKIVSLKQIVFDTICFLTHVVLVLLFFLLNMFFQSILIATRKNIHR